MPIESSYAGANLAGHWGDRAATMEAISYDRLPALAACDGSLFTAADLDAVRDQLDDEFTAVDDVAAMIANFKSPLTTGGAQISPLRVDAISERIRSSVNAPAEQEVEGVDPAEIAEDGFLLLGSIPEVGELTGADFIASMIGLVSDLTTDDSGASTLEYDAAAADDLGATIDEGYAAAAANFDKVFAILVGDWGKLTTAAARAQPGAEWDWNDAEGVARGRRDGPGGAAAGVAAAVPARLRRAREAGAPGRARATCPATRAPTSARATTDAARS